MAILQGLIALLGRSAGKILNTILGWAVRALFGATSGVQQNLLIDLVAIAALWPLLVVGIVAPRIGAFLVAFVPISKSISDDAIRVVWIVLALLVPAIVGTALTLNAPHESKRALVRVARGYPVTLGISLAFWLSAIVVPLLQLRSAMRGHQQSYVPLITGKNGYEQTAARIQRILLAHGLQVDPYVPSIWVGAPLQILRLLAGNAIDHYVPQQLVYLAGPDLEIVLYPSSILLRGSEQRTTISHGLITETLTRMDVYQTTNSSAQNVERQIRRVWAALEQNSAAHTNSPWLLRRLKEIAEEIVHLDVAYDEWQIVYRQALQLGRALKGEPQLLTATEENDMEESEMRIEADVSEPVAATSSLTTPELLGEIGAKVVLLVTKEVDLAKQEVKEDVRAEIAAIKAFAAAAVAGVTTLNLLLIAAVFALAPYLELLRATLGAAGIMLLITIAAAAIAWRKRVKKALDLTRKTVEEDVQWAKEQLA
jgi:hypothetical protein